MIQQVESLNQIQTIILTQDLSLCASLFEQSYESLLNDVNITMYEIKSAVDSQSYLFDKNKQMVIEIIFSKILESIWYVLIIF